MKKYIIVIVFIEVLILGFYFYWYEWRPSEIRKRCNDSAFRGSMDSYDESSFTQSGRMDLKDKFYKDCLRYEGLKI